MPAERSTAAVSYTHLDVYKRQVPGDATTTMVKYMYDSAFVRFQFGYGAAVAYGIFVIIAIFSVFSLLVTKDKQDEYGKKKGGKA